MKKVIYFYTTHFNFIEQEQETNKLLLLLEENERDEYREASIGQPRSGEMPFSDHRLPPAHFLRRMVETTQCHNYIFGQCSTELRVTNVFSDLIDHYF